MLFILEQLHDLRKPFFMGQVQGGFALIIGACSINTGLLQEQAITTRCNQVVAFAKDADVKNRFRGYRA